MSNVQQPNVDLRECLLALPPVDLLAVTLVQQDQNLVTEAQLIEAVKQLMSYTERCQDATERLNDVRPIPVLAITIGEFGV